MKLTLKAILGLLVAVSFTACEDEEATQPVAQVSVDKLLYNTNESMVVKFIGDAENVVLYPGDKDHDYELREQSNTGLIVNKGTISYAYQQPGTFKAVCVATNHCDEGQSIKTDTCSFYVRVIDDVHEFTSLSAATVLYDEVYAQEVNETDYMLKIPRYVKNKTKHNLPVKLTAQKLNISVASDSTKIYIDGNEYSANKNYNITKPVEIKLVSYEGTEGNYTLYAVNYGEFKTFTLAGTKYKYTNYTRLDDQYGYAEFNFTVPAGTDVTALVPEFELYDSENDKVYVDGVEQVSGETAQDFTNPVTYTFVSNHADNADIKVESTVVVSVTVE